MFVVHGWWSLRRTTALAVTACAWAVTAAVWPHPLSPHQFDGCMCAACL